MTGAHVIWIGGPHPTTSGWWGHPNPWCFQGGWHRFLPSVQYWVSYITLLGPANQQKRGGFTWEMEQTKTGCLGFWVILFYRDYYKPLWRSISLHSSGCLLLPAFSLLNPMPNFFWTIWGFPTIIGTLTAVSTCKTSYTHLQPGLSIGFTGVLSNLQLLGALTVEVLERKNLRMGWNGASNMFAEVIGDPSHLNLRLTRITYLIPWVKRKHWQVTTFLFRWQWICVWID